MRCSIAAGLLSPWLISSAASPPTCGAACDVPSHLYSLSFAPNPFWSRAYASQPEILSYIEDCYDRFEVRGKVRTGVDIVAAHWDEAGNYWRLQDRAGNACHARVLVSAIGMFNTPKWPDLRGLHDFAGTLFHSARWPDGSPDGGFNGTTGVDGENDGTAGTAAPDADTNDGHTGGGDPMPQVTSPAYYDGVRPAVEFDGRVNATAFALASRSKERASRDRTGSSSSAIRGSHPRTSAPSCASSRSTSRRRRTRAASSRPHSSAAAPRRCTSSSADPSGAP